MPAAGPKDAAGECAPAAAGVPRRAPTKRSSPSGKSQYCAAPGRPAMFCATAPGSLGADAAVGARRSDRVACGRWLYFRLGRRLIDYQGRPLGTDFSNVYAAGTYVLDRHGRRPFDSPAAICARTGDLRRQRHSSTAGIIRRSSCSSPRSLALMPYLLALAVWQGVTLALYLCVIVRSPRCCIERRTADRGRRWPRPLTICCSPLAFPAVFVNIGHGHNGFLTAALIGGALALLDKRPIAGRRAVRPPGLQAAIRLLIPLALLAAGRWRTFAAAAATVVALDRSPHSRSASMSGRAFFASTHFTRVVVLEQAIPAGTRSRACFHGCGCGAAP